LWGLLSATRRARFAWAETRTKGRTREEREAIRENLRTTLQTWLLAWRDVLMTAAGASADLNNPDQAERIQAVAAQVDAAAARAQISALEKAATRLGSANLQLLLEVLLLDLPHLNL
jgi:hypothetical protein